MKIQIFDTIPGILQRNSLMKTSKKVTLTISSGFL